jgi:tRNA threonylcarbamoyladenosine biosynthesis protein TsaB
MLLAIDTATAQASIALHDGTSLRGEHTWEAHNRHTVTLVPNIARMLGALDLTPEALTAIAVCIGPGSYTGVRIGVAVAKGMATPRPRPLIGVTTLDILAAAQPRVEGPLYAVFAAGRRRIGYARYRWVDERWQAETEVTVDTWAAFAAEVTASSDGAAPAVVVGEVGARGREALADAPVEIPAPAWHLRRAGFLAERAWARVRSGHTDDPATLTPLYAR